MNSYPIKFRKRVLEALEKGHSVEDVSEMFGVNRKTIRNCENLKEETCGLMDKPAKRSSYKINKDSLLKYYEDNPHSTNEEAANAFGYSKSGIIYAKAALRIARKKHNSIH